MELKDFQNRLFDLLNTSNNLNISNIQMDKNDNIITLSTAGGKIFEIEYCQLTQPKRHTVNAEHDFDPYNMLCCEFHSRMLPLLLYRGRKSEKDEFFYNLQNDGKNLVHFLFSSLCQKEGISHLYNENLLNVEYFRQKGVSIIQITLPHCDLYTCTILRSYVLSFQHDNGTTVKKFFLIRRFDDGKIFIIYISPRMKEYSYFELTDSIADREYEHLMLFYIFLKLFVQDFMAKEHRNKRKEKKSQSQKDD